MAYDAGAAGRGDQDDVLFSDDAFLLAVAQAEARHAGRPAGLRPASDGPGISGRRAVERDGHANAWSSGLRTRGALGASEQSYEDERRKRVWSEGMSSRTASSGRPHGRSSVAGVHCDGQQPEGEYMAALRGSNSELWQSSGMGKSVAPAGVSNRGASGNVVTGGSGKGSGSCFKCGMEGHWARECTGGGGPVSSAVNGTGKNAQGSTDVPERLCPCGAGACLVLTANTEKNQGRSFYKCPRRKDEGQCPFFEWCDQVEQSNATGRLNFQGFPQHRQLDCTCGGGPCAILTAKTEKNMGRQFYKCPLPQGQGCSFFQWCDEAGRDAGRPPSNVLTRPNDYAANVKSPTAAGGSRFSFGQGGHWSRDCPSQQTRDASNSGGYNARGQGQYPTQQGGNPNSGGSCYKCGDPGHWANRCATAVSLSLQQDKDEF